MQDCYGKPMTNPEGRRNRTFHAEHPNQKGMSGDSHGV